MKRKLVALSLGLGMLGASASAALAADAAAGKAVYEKSCVGCHGADGKGNAAMTKVMGEGLNLTKETAKKSDDQLMKAIAEGQGKMPAQKLSKDEQKAVVGYVRSLSK
jgi:mono/diheme cytochrome c family protein